MRRAPLPVVYQCARLCTQTLYCVTMRPTYCCVPMRLVVYQSTSFCNYGPCFLLCTYLLHCVTMRPLPVVYISTLLCTEGNLLPVKKKCKK